MTEKKPTGLCEKEVDLSREKYGSNALTEEKRKTLFRRYVDNLKDPIIRVLLAAVALEILVTLGRCNWFEVGGILLAVLTSTFVSTYSEKSGEDAFRRLSEESAGKRVTVIREGKEQKIPIDEVVVDDLIVVRQGEVVSADGIVVSGRVSVNQSALNGESRECEKYPTKDAGDGKDLLSPSRIYRGSEVRAGSCTARVCAVGAGTFFGMVAKDVQEETRESPLKLRLSTLASQISKIGYILAAAVAAIFLLKTLLIANAFRPERILAMGGAKIFSLCTEALMLALTVVVVAVPEGLPMMVTVVLSANMKRMMKDRILVKKPVGIETAGSLNILFTDKTGTLTEGCVRLDRIVTPDGEYRSPSALAQKHPQLYRAILLSLADADESRNGTELALLDFFKGERPTEAPASVIPFTSEKKYSGVRMKDGTVLCKGAMEVVLKNCSGYLSERGEAIVFDAARAEALQREKTVGGERVVTFAKTEKNGKTLFLCFAVLKDKIRKGTRAEVEKITGAGVQTVMMTGDRKETAIAVARECGIVRHESDLALSGEELRAMSDEEVREVLPRLRVLSRALPQDKTRLVRLSQECGLVVGMTGDGVNDAPSLKLADVGFSMGSGTEIAKAAGDIVLLDDSFSAIGKTVLYGRTIFKSIRKFITFQLMMNLAACGITLFGELFGFVTPITIVQMLWINMIMDTLGGLAFAGEAPIAYYMKEKPKRRDEKILTKEMIVRVAVTGGYTLALCLVFWLSPAVRAVFRPEENALPFLTGFFAFFVFSGIFNALHTRSERLGLFHGIGKNRAFIAIMSAISVVELLMIYFGGALFRCTPLTPRELFSSILLAATVLPFELCRRVLMKFL